MLKILQIRLQQYENQEFPSVQDRFGIGRRTRDQIANICWIMEKQGNSRKKKSYFCIIDYTKAFDCVNHNKLWEILKRMRVPDYLTCLLRNLHAGQEATEPNMKQWAGSKLGKEYDKALYCNSAYVLSLQSTSYEMPCWMNHKLELRFPG